MAKTNITGHGKDYCGTPDCKGQKCNGPGNQRRTNNPNQYTSILEATAEAEREFLNQGKVSPEQKQIEESNQTILAIYDQTDQAIQNKDKKALKEILDNHPGLMTSKIVSSGVLSTKELNKLRREEGLIRLADMLRSPNLEPRIYTDLEELIGDEALGDKEMEIFIKKECWKSLRDNPNTPKKMIIDDLSNNIPKLSKLIREIEELKQHPLIVGQPNPTIEVMEDQASELSQSITAAVKHPSITGQDIPKIFKYGRTEEFFESILSNPNCEPQWINSLPEEYSAVKEKFLKHPKLNQGNISKFSKSTVPSERLAIASNPSAGEEIVTELCNDIRPDIANKAKQHSNAPEEFIGPQISNLKQKKQSLIHELNSFINDKEIDPRFEQEAIIQLQRQISEVDKEIDCRKARLQKSAKDQSTSALDDLLN